MPDVCSWGIMKENMSRTASGATTAQSCGVSRPGFDARPRVWQEEVSPHLKKLVRVELGVQRVHFLASFPLRSHTGFPERELDVTAKPLVGFFESQRSGKSLVGQS